MSERAASPAAGTAAGSPLQLEENSPGAFLARGALIFATARRARNLGFAALSGAPPGGVRIDCSGIEASDSAGMAVLLDWLAFARKSGLSLQFSALPAQVKAIARISDVLDLLEKGV